MPSPDLTPALRTPPRRAFAPGFGPGRFLSLLKGAQHVRPLEASRNRNAVSVVHVVRGEGAACADKRTCIDGRDSGRFHARRPRSLPPSRTEHVGIPRGIRGRLVRRSQAGRDQTVTTSAPANSLRLSAVPNGRDSNAGAPLLSVIDHLREMA